MYKRQAYDCTGCGSCANVCPGKKGEKALVMGNMEANVASQDIFDFGREIEVKPEVVAKFKPETVKGSQFKQPLLEFSGACAGCGETPYAKLVTQLFGDRKMCIRDREIAAAIGEGAQAFLTAEYKILIFFVIVLFVLIGFGIGNWVTDICFVVGALFSTLAGYFGMTVATKANVRTANAAKEGGMNKALSIAFSGGAVMGMCVAGLGVLGVSAIYMITKNVDVLSGSVSYTHLDVYKRQM